MSTLPIIARGAREIPPSNVNPAWIDAIVGVPKGLICSSIAATRAAPHRRFGSRRPLDRLFAIEIVGIPKYDDCSIEVHPSRGTCGLRIGAKAQMPRVSSNTSKPSQEGEWSIPSLREPRYSQSLERGLAILGCFTPERPVLGIADIADDLGMSRSTTHRYVITLVALGLPRAGRLTQVPSRPARHRPWHVSA